MFWLKNKNKNLGIISLLGSAFIYGWFGVFSKLIAYDLPVFYASFTRDILGVVILALLLYINRKRDYKKIKNQDYLWIVFRSFFGLISFLCSYVAFIYMEIGTAYFIYFGMSVLSGYLLGFLLFKEKINFIKGLALFLAILGLFIVYQINITPHSGLYIILAGLSGITASAWSIFSKKVSDRYSALQINFFDFLIFAVMTLTISIFLKETWVAPEFTNLWLNNLIFGLSFVITGQLIVVGFNNLDAQIGSLIMLTEILFGIILGFIFFQEVVTVLTLMGGLLIITAVALPELQLEKKPFWKKLLKR